MTTVDIAVFLVAGLVGSYGGGVNIGGRGVNLAWGIIAIWALLKLLHVL